MSLCRGRRDAPALTPPHTPTPFTGQRGECEKRRRTTDKVIHTEKLLLWQERQQPLSCSIVGAQGPPMSSKQKARGTPLLDTHKTHPQDFLLRKHGSDGREGGKLGPEQCNCVHVCHYTPKCMHSHRRAQWEQTDCGWYHYSKHRWQEWEMDFCLIEHIYIALFAAGGWHGVTSDMRSWIFKIKDYIYILILNSKFK